MKKTIIVATDFSSAAYNAANYAADMAFSVKADLVLLHVYRVPLAFSEVPIPVTEEEMRQHAEKSIHDLREEISRRINNQINVTVDVRSGSFYDELKDACSQLNPYLVILGSQGTTAAERLLFGSHAVHAMKHLSWPLITVPQTATFSSIKKIGLASDLSNAEEPLPAEKIRILVNDLHARLHILNTAKKGKFKPETIFESASLQKLLSSLSPEFHFIANDDIDEGIIDFAETNKIDLLVVIPHSHTLAEKLTRRSHTKQLVLHSKVPVMAIHP
jgi:nucleotide-binding universal stress UspA family protein